MQQKRYNGESIWNQTGTWLSDSFDSVWTGVVHAAPSIIIGAVMLILLLAVAGLVFFWVFDRVVLSPIDQNQTSSKRSRT